MTVPVTKTTGSENNVGNKLNLIGHTSDIYGSRTSTDIRFQFLVFWRFTDTQMDARSVSDTPNKQCTDEFRSFKKFPTEHKDIVHGISYDFYGKRLATCSSDQWIRVWDLDEGNEWKKTSEWRAHDGSVWSVRWAHPEFGQILASCSFDRSVRIWEEVEGTDGSVKWMLKATLGDSVKQSVQDIQFAPKHLGLKLATCTRGGIVRIYEAMDITKLAHWTITHQFEPQKNTCINSICWNPSPFDDPMLVVAGEDKVITVWQYNLKNKQWQQECKLVGHDHPVYHVSWAPNLGRSYHMIASGSKDKTVRIWHLDINSSNDISTTTPTSSTSMEAKQVAVFDDHRSSVWSVEWNITGTILASSGDDGLVRFWKRNFLNDWKCLLEVRADGDTQATKREYRF
eukprot:TRINITY_DN1093_c1_g5_i1.p1 TRINITY_DN1093_c1_g5~~TRINITY_DN1093_c1_g5_i1.p1  ORF type:complete len:398 (+),score=45.59 TRINITY_DN1093_c1_g5_i1:425-1618(+)